MHSGRPVHRLVTAWAHSAPNSNAIVCKDESVTFSELNAIVDHLATRLTANGVARGSCVGVCVRRTPRMIAALLAVMKVGAAYVPLDITHPADRLRYVVRDSDLRVVVCDDVVSASAFTHHQSLLLTTDCPESLVTEQSSVLDCDVSPEDACYVIYTSGSTGLPKGVRVTHRAVTNVVSAFSDMLNVRPSDRWLAATTLAFDIAALEWMVPLSSGASVVLAGVENLTDGRQLRALADLYGATIVQGTPAFWRMILAAGPLPRSLRHALCGGEAMNPHLANRLVAGPGVDVWNVYGPTETTIWSLAHRLNQQEYVKSPPIGTPIRNTTVYLLNDNCEEVGASEVGEIVIGGDGVAQGYVGKPDLTTDRFVPDIFSNRPGVRMFRTGDLARRTADGEIEFIGRRDSQVKVRGYRIELGDVEAAMARLPNVLEAAATTRRDSSQENVLVGYIVPGEGAALSEADIKHRLSESLPSYMVPSQLFLIAKMPLTLNCKVDREKLPLFDEHQDRRAFPEAITETEKVLAAIWTETLEREDIGLEDDFFTLGGHSLLAAMMLMKISEALAVELSISDLLEYSTIAALAGRIDRDMQDVGAATAAEGLRYPLEAR